MKRQYLDFCEVIFAALGVLFFTRAIENLLGEGSIVIGLIRWFITLGSISLIFLRLNIATYKVKRNPWLFIVIGLTLISFLWSDFSDYSFAVIRSEFLPMTAFGLYLGTSFDIKQQVKVLSIGLGVGLIISWATAIAVPSIGRDNEIFIGAWTGVYGHKNSASTLMILTAATLLLMSTKKIKTKLLVNSRSSIAVRMLASLAAIFIFLTTSATGLVLLISIPFSLFLYTEFKWKGKASILFLSLFALIFSLLLGILLDNWQDIVVGIGRDPTLTGRVPMWNVAIDKIADRPFLGYGKGGFWAPESPYPLQVGRAVGLRFIPPHIHNGFIDTALDIGLIGLICLFASLLIVIWRSLKQAYFRSTSEDLFPLCFLIVFIINNITESYILYQYHLLWPLYVAIAMNVGYSGVNNNASFTNITNRRRMSETLSRKALSDP